MADTPIDNQDKKLLKSTKIDKERILKKRAGEDREKLAAMGQESETKGAKWVMEEDRKKEQEEKKIQEAKQEILTDARKKRVEYTQKLYDEMMREMVNWTDELPEGVSWYPQITSKGLVMWVHVGIEWHAKGMKVTGEVKYDMNGVYKMITQAITFAQEKTHPEGTTDRIIKPTKSQVSSYGRSNKSN